MNSKGMRGYITFFLGCLGVVLFIGTTIVGGFQFSNYSHMQQYISETYATGTPWGNYLRTFGFIPSGILITLFALMVRSIVPRSKRTTLACVGIGVFYGMGTVITSVFPCDPGCPDDPMAISISQWIHNLSGALTYLVTPLCVLLIGIAAKKWVHGRTFSLLSILFGTIAGCFVMVLFSDPQGKYIGLYQRIIEGSILFWMISLSFYVKSNYAVR